MKKLLLTFILLLKKTEIKIALAAVLILSLIPAHFGRYDRVIGAIADAGHFWFYLVAFLYLNRVLTYPRRLLSVLVFISGTIELIQPYVDRDGDLQDFAVSSLGAFCGYLAILKLPGILKVLAVLGSSVPLLFPIFWRYDALQYQVTALPILADFKDPHWKQLWEPTSPDKLPSAALAVDDKDELIVRAIPGKEWPGTVYLNQFLSWSDYQALEIEVELPSEELLSIRIDDNGDCKEFDSRFNRSFLLPQGLSKIIIPLDEIRMTMSGRIMDMSSIKRVALFSQKKERAEKVFKLKSMRLL